MRFFHGCIVAALICAMVFAVMPAVAQSQSAKTPVLVELFTSEGCSSCPPADALLMKLEQEQPVAGAEVIVLGEHVDYWDGLGWRDRFSSRLYTDRQQGYGRRFNLQDVYTPQMVVDGVEQFVGNDGAKARQAIARGVKTAKVGLGISGLVVAEKRVTGSVMAAPGASGLAKGDVYAALVDPVAVTDVKRGENGGRQLRHVGVVRVLARIGSLEDLARGPVKFALAAPEDAVPAKERVVVFVQKAGQGQVIGAFAENVVSLGNMSKR